MNPKKCCNKLIEIGSKSLNKGHVLLADKLKEEFGGNICELEALLEERNGFYAFEGALHVFGIGDTNNNAGLLEWNKICGSLYGRLADGCFFFAENVFAEQYCFSSDGSVWEFDPETAERTRIGKCLDDWCCAILSDFEFWTGYPLAHEWQIRNGALRPGDRLIPKVPFVLGGEYSVENLREMKSIDGIEFLAKLAIEVHDLGDGEKVSWKL